MYVVISHRYICHPSKVSLSSMFSNQTHPLAMDDAQQNYLRVLEMGCTQILHAVFTTVIELNVFEIIAKAGPEAQLSAAEISSHLPTQNQQAPAILERMLQLLASYSVLKCVHVSNQDGRGTRLYGLTPMCRYLVADTMGISMGPAMLCYTDKAMADSWSYLKDAVLEGKIPFNKANKMDLFEYFGKSSTLNETFNQAMHSETFFVLRAVLQNYKGFEALKELVDVGGGLGITLNAIISKYPGIRGINFDLPQVIKDAPIRTGVENLPGDMFEYVPKGEAILLKNILHDWTDEHCLKLLKNCYNALPEHGKVIVIEMILPTSPENDLLSRAVFFVDIMMLALTSGGRERTLKEFDALAKGAGFIACKLVCQTFGYGILEFYKSSTLNSSEIP
nr:corynanthe 9-O-methyltransferase [Hamelia patens]